MPPQIQIYLKRMVSRDLTLYIDMDIGHNYNRVHSGSVDNKRFY